MQTAGQLVANEFATTRSRKSPHPTQPAGEIPSLQGAEEHATKQCFEVERRATHEQNVLPAAFDFVGRPVGVHDELGNAVILGWVDDVDQMVRDPARLVRRWLGCSDVHTPINGHRIERNDFGVQLLGKWQRSVGLPRGGRTRQIPRIQQGRFHPVVVFIHRLWICIIRPRILVRPRISGCIRLNSTANRVFCADTYYTYSHCIPVSTDKSQSSSHESGDILDSLMEQIHHRAATLPEGSYTTKLIKGGDTKMGAKILEEVLETVLAAGESGEEGHQHLIREACDVIYHLWVLLGAHGVHVDDLRTELARREGVSGLVEKASRTPSSVPKI